MVAPIIMLLSGECDGVLTTEEGGRDARFAGAREEQDFTAIA